MVELNSPTELTHQKDILMNFMHALLGLYLWEFATSFDFDWQYISRKRKFHWPIVFYFAGRYSYLFGVIGSAVSSNTTMKINCHQFYIFNQVLISASIGFASITLSIRTMVIWSWNRYIVAPLILVIMGHWSLLLRNFPIHGAWIPSKGCVLQSVDIRLPLPVTAYSMAFDFIILCLTGWKLALSPRASGRSKLFTHILRGGLVYFALTFLSNLIATIFYLLYLNSTITAIAGFPVAIVSTIAACRIVRNLLEYTVEGSEGVVVSADGSPLASLPSDTHHHLLPAANKKNLDGTEVHTKCVDLSAAIKAVKTISLDARGGANQKFDNRIDIEAQVIASNHLRS